MITSKDNELFTLDVLHADPNGVNGAWVVYIAPNCVSPKPDYVSTNAVDVSQAIGIEAEIDELR
jgi:hypothetical protein